MMEELDLSAHSYLYIVTLEGYQKIQKILWKLKREQVV